MEVPSMGNLRDLKCDEEMKRICEFERLNSRGNSEEKKRRKWKILKWRSWKIFERGWKRGWWVEGEKFCFSFPQLFERILRNIQIKFRELYKKNFLKIFTNFLKKFKKKISQKNSQRKFLKSFSQENVSQISQKNFTNFIKNIAKSHSARKF